MSARGLHKLMGGTFQHASAQCAGCALRREHGEWEGYCTLRRKVLSYAQRPAKKCKDFAPPETAD